MEDQKEGASGDGVSSGSVGVMVTDNNTADCNSTEKNNLESMETSQVKEGEEEEEAERRQGVRCENEVPMEVELTKNAPLNGVNDECVMGEGNKEVTLQKLQLLNSNNSSNKDSAVAREGGSEEEGSGGEGGGGGEERMATRRSLRTRARAMREEREAKVRRSRRSRGGRGEFSI